MKKVYTSILLCLVLGVSGAQVPTRSVNPESLSAYAMFKQAGPRAMASVNVSNVDVRALLAEDEKEKDTGRPVRFGKDLDVNFGLSNSGSWETVKGGRIWRLLINVPGAKTVNMIFNKFHLPEGAQLFISNGERTMVTGPIDQSQNNASDNYSTGLLKGNSVVIELFEPHAVAGKSRLQIAKVIHGYKQVPFLGFGTSAPCNINANCAQGNNWNDEKNMVAMVLLQNNTRICSGTLVNNACQNLTPNFLTAFHCLDSNLNGVADAGEITTAQNWNFMFQYMSPACTPNTDDTNFFSFSGSTFRAGWNISDFALVQLNQRPAANTGIRYAGWSRTTAAATSSASLHHPQGDVMKIAVENNTAVSADFNGVGPNSHWLVNFDAGTVEPGSSGAPLFNQNHRVVGQLHGGSLNNGLPNGGRCLAFDARYGRFDVSWAGGGTAATRLSDWLTDNPAVTEVGPATIPTVSGPTLLCSGQFVLNNAPAGAAVTWSVSPSYAVSPSSGSGTVANVTAAANLDATITFSVGCGTAATFSHNFHSGAPSVSNIVVNTSMCPGYSQVVSATVSGNPTSLSWSITSGNAGSAYLTDYGNGSAYFNSYTPDCYGLDLSMTNACGSSLAGTTICVDYCFAAYKVYPNPASEYVTIEFEHYGKAEVMPDQITLYSEKTQKPVYNLGNTDITAATSAEGVLKIPVAEIPRGTYYLHIVPGKKSGQKVDKIRILRE